MTLMQGSEVRARTMLHDEIDDIFNNNGQVLGQGASSHEGHRRERVNFEFGEKLE